MSQTNNTPSEVQHNNYHPPKFKCGDWVEVERHNVEVEIFDVEWIDSGWLYYCHTPTGVRKFRQWDLRNIY